MKFFAFPIVVFCSLTSLALLSPAAEAATLTLTPNTGVFTVGATINLQVVVNTQGQAVNAAEGTLSFNPQEMQIVSVNRTNSIFNLWTTEPSFSNTAGTISFSGGTPTGYTGGRGTILQITARLTTAGTPRMTMSNGSVLAADGRGTNILTSMSGASFTVSAVTTTPTPEVIVEYVAPRNTPRLPQIESSTHVRNEWSSSTTAVLRWNLPSGVTAVRTLLDVRPTSIPTRVYDPPISSIVLDDLPQGISFFHLQFQNADGWGEVAHYRLAVDSRPLTELSLDFMGDFDDTAVAQSLLLSYSTSTDRAPITQIRVQLNGQEATVKADLSSGEIILPPLQPGFQTVIVEVVNAAGNSMLLTKSFTISAFEAPYFTDFTERILSNLIPAWRGLTRPNALVAITVQQFGVLPVVHEVQANSDGEFVFIPPHAYNAGIFDISLKATDASGAVSHESERYRVIVEDPGYIRFGFLILNVLSTIVTLIILILGTVLMTVFTWRRLQGIRRVVAKESREVEYVFLTGISQLKETLKSEAQQLAVNRKNGTLTKAEAHLVTSLEQSMSELEERVMKEVADVEAIARNNNKV